MHAGELQGGALIKLSLQTLGKFDWGDVSVMWDVAVRTFSQPSHGWETHPIHPSPQLEFMLMC
jgi:hypothetical protein